MFNFFMTVYVAIAFDSLLVIMEWVGTNFSARAYGSRNLCSSQFGSMTFGLWLGRATEM